MCRASLTAFSKYQAWNKPTIQSRRRFESLFTKVSSLSSLIAVALDINYNESKLSKEQLRSLFKLKRVPSLWHVTNKIDPNNFYSQPLRHEVKSLPKVRQVRNEMLVNYVSKNVHINSHENSLPVVIQRNYYSKTKSETGTQLLTRLLQKEKKLDLDH